jgi:hypothetical protein
MLSLSKTFFVLSTVLFLGAPLEKSGYTRSSEPPGYTVDAQLKLPANYREWVYLTSDYYASDQAAIPKGAEGAFNNIFVDPRSYRTFLKTGRWPDKTMLLVDERNAIVMEPKPPNQKAAVQSSGIGLAIHVKDETRFPGKWAFFDFSNGARVGKMIPVTAGCYSCHAARGAEDKTFVQFYPTLLPVAKSRNTLDPGYLSGDEVQPTATK